MLGVTDYGTFVATVLLFLFIPGPGNLALVLGSRQHALKAWRNSAESAAALAMPYDEALALLVLAQYEGGASGTVAHARASALLEGMALPEPPSLFPHARR